MRCSRCQHENPLAAKFCQECGARLAASCPSCATELPPSAKFCHGCGTPQAAGSASARAVDREPRAYTPNHLAEKILTTRAALEGERKQVTVLFADVKGSMDLAEQLDAEEWHRILDRFFQILADGVHRFEGTINQYTGDGIMALFGAPIAHEDHAQRACYAALYLGHELRRYGQALRREHGLDFSVRMGLNTGEVVVGKIGDDLRMDYTAQGHAVGLAARMQQIAEAGKAYLSESSAALVRGFFELEDLGEFKLKGAVGPVRAFSLEGVGPLRTRLDLSRARGLSKFVGRANEMATLQVALERAIAGHGQMVGVVAEAGTGKSRLCYEFAERCRANGIPVAEAHAVAHGRLIPFLPILELLRSFFEIDDSDGEEITRRKIAGTLLLLDKEFEETLPLLFDFLGVPDPSRPTPRLDAEARQRQLFGIFRGILRARSEQQPGVIMLEDLHWIDDGSDGFLESAVEVVPRTRTLLLLNFRPEYHATWMQKSYYQQLPLVPLGREAIEELLRDLLGVDPSLAGLEEHIRGRTGGNPFFVEEVVQSLAEAGTLEGTRGRYRLACSAEEFAIPATIQAVLAARIDRLPEREKRVLQTAAVIGKEFTGPVLRRITEVPERELTEALSRLVESEFLYEETLYPEAEYAFKHPLSQELAYASQLSEPRSRVHAAVARAVEELNADKLDERAAHIAYHWEAAGQAVRAARWYQRAALWAGRNDAAAAFAHWSRVRNLLGADPESREAEVLATIARQQLLGLHWRIGLPEDAAATLFEEGKELATRAKNWFLLGGLFAHFGAAKRGAGAIAESLELCREALRIAERTGHAGYRAAISTSLVESLEGAGHLSESLRFVEEALALCPDDPRAGWEGPGFSPYAFLVLHRGSLLGELGRLDEARSELDRAVGIAREIGDHEVLAWSLGAYPRLAELTGGYRSVIRSAEEGVEIAEKAGHAGTQVAAHLALGIACRLNREWDRSLANLEHALALARERRVNLMREVDLLTELAYAALGHGDRERARAVSEEALLLAKDRGMPHWEGLAHLARARVKVQGEGAKAAVEIETSLDRALTLVRASGARGYEPLILEERAALAGLLRDGATRERELREAHRLFVETGAAGHAERLARELRI